jgi:hypothetical protein
MISRHAALGWPMALATLVGAATGARRPKDSGATTAKSL